MHVTWKGKKNKSAYQMKGPLNHYLSTISHNYGQTMLYHVMYIGHASIS